MISIPRLLRHAESNDDAKLLDEVLRNRRPLPLPVRLRLSEPASLNGSGLGLALQRVIDLTYRPTAASAFLLRQLLARQDPDGGFGSVVGTAIAAGGLLSFAEQSAVFAKMRQTPAGRSVDDHIGEPLPDLLARVRVAIDRALHWLRTVQDNSPPEMLCGPDGLIGDAVDSAVVLWQLQLSPLFAGAVRFEALLTAIDEAGLRHDRATGPLLEQAWKVDGSNHRERGSDQRSVAA